MAIRLLAILLTPTVRGFDAQLLGQPTNYVVGPQDILAITSFDQRIDRKISVDSADRLFRLSVRQAAGLTFANSKRLKKQLKDGQSSRSQLSVGVKPTRARRFISSARSEILPRTRSLVT